jgi:hypothetical protein
MKNEMDCLGTNEEQNQAWLNANQITLFAVGMVWIGMIVSRLITGDTPWFLIAMVPAFALLHLGTYVAYR